MKIPGGESYPSSGGAPGIPLPRMGTRTAFLSSVRQTHWSIIQLSRSLSLGDLSTSEAQFTVTCTFVNLLLYLSTVAPVVRRVDNYRPDKSLSGR